MCQASITVTERACKSPTQKIPETKKKNTRKHKREQDKGRFSGENYKSVHFNCSTWCEAISGLEEPIKVSWAGHNMFPPLFPSHLFSCWGQSAHYCSPTLSGWWSCQGAGGSVAADPQCKKPWPKSLKRNPFVPPCHFLSMPPTMAKAQRTEAAGNLVLPLVWSVSLPFFSWYQGRVAHWHSHTTGKSEEYMCSARTSRWKSHASSYTQRIMSK